LRCPWALVTRRKAVAAAAAVAGSLTVSHAAPAVTVGRWAVSVRRGAALPQSVV
jgi:hypothetical protein